MNLKEHLPGEDETLDSFYHGRILVLQKKKGYRFSVDAPLLAGFIQTSRADVLLELGAGNGIISLLLSVKPFRHIFCLEIQKSLADLARRNVRLNCLEGRITILQEDLLSFRSRKKFDIIFSNPPYIRKASGRLSVSEEKSVAKHEIKCDIFGIMRKCSDLLKRRGRAYFIYPAKREADFFEAAEKSGLNVVRYRYVHPRKSRPANLFLAECRFRDGKRQKLRPLILFDEKGNYTPEIKNIFRGATGAQPFK